MSGSPIGDVAVRVGADVEPLKRGMNNASHSVTKFSDKASKKLKRVTANTVKMAAAAVAAGAAMTAALFAKQSKVIDALAKTADALDVTTESLQALNHLAELNGVSSTAMAKGLQKMEVRLGEAERKGGAAAEALEDLGINLKDINTLSADEQIEVLAKALANVESQTVKASIATDIFGRDGLKMVKVLNQIQKEGIQPTVDLLKKYGAAITRVDAAQVEAANDAFLKAQEVVTGLANTITVKLSPFVSEASDRFVEAAAQGEGFGKVVNSVIMTSIRIAGKFADVLHGLRVVFKGVEVIAVSFGAAVVSVFRLAAEGVTIFADAAIRDVNKIIEGLNLIPGVDIANIDYFTDSEFMKGLRNFSEETVRNISIAKEQLQSLAMEEMPSSGVEAFLDRVIEKQRLVAEGAVTISPQEEEQERLIKEQEMRELAQVAEQEHLKKMVNMNQKAYGAITNLIRNKWGDNAASVANSSKSIVNTIGANSKKAFKISKAWAISDALISTYQGIAKGVAAGYPMAIPLVAAAAATGFAQVQQIKSQSFGGAGSAAARGGGTPGQASNAIGIGGDTGGGGGSPEMTRTVVGINPDEMISGRTMISLMQEALDNGSILVPEG